MNNFILSCNASIVLFLFLEYDPYICKIYFYESNFMIMYNKIILYNF